MGGSARTGAEGRRGRTNEPRIIEIDKVSALLAASLPYTTITEEHMAVEVETRLSKLRVLPASDCATDCGHEVHGSLSHDDSILCVAEDSS